MTEEELAAIEARANAATPGPWVPHGEEIDGWDLLGVNGAPIALGDKYEPDRAFTDRENVSFCASARSDVPALVAECRRLRALVEQAESIIHDEFCGTSHNHICVAFTASIANAAEVRGQDTAVALMESSERAAVRAMKERCARLAEGSDPPFADPQRSSPWRRSVAAAIRALKDE